MTAMCRGRIPDDCEMAEQETREMTGEYADASADGAHVGLGPAWLPLTGVLCHKRQCDRDNSIAVLEARTANSDGDEGL
jgi:hypothetical protein